MEEKKCSMVRRGVHMLLSVLIAIAIIIIFLISSFEIGAYSDYGFYEKEYEKYHVEEKVYMEMSDIIDVTKYMMSYLRGNETELSFRTEVAGREMDFFNDQDRLHMADVQNLFLRGLMLRRVAVVVLIVSVILLILLKGDWKVLIPWIYQRTLAVFMAIIVGLGVLISQNFNKYFVIFHHIFFDNDLWIFDPAEDYMIRMLPEEFFYDMVMRIGGIFVASLLGFLVITMIWRSTNKNKYYL